MELYKPQLAFWQGGGEMGELTRNYDWSGTSLGAPDSWPQSLRTTISIVLNSRFPMLLFWGAEKICFYNEALRPALGSGEKYPHLLGTSTTNAFPESWSSIQPAIDKVMSSGEAVWEEDQLLPVYRNGRHEDAYWTLGYSAVKGESGDVAGTLVTATETTSAVLGRKKLEHSEARFKALVQEAPVSTCLLVGPEMRVEVVNEIMINYWGKDEQVIGKPLVEAVPELKGQPFLDILDKIWQTGETYEEKGARAELMVNGVMGTYYFDYIYKPVRNEAGEIYGVMNMSIDVTAQVLAQQKVEESRRELLALFEESPVAIATINAGEELVFQSSNAFYAELVGRRPEEIVGKPLLQALPELAGQGFDELLQKVIATGKPFVAPEVPVELLRNGALETIYVNLTYQPSRYGTDHITGVLVVATDVTQQVISRRQVEASETKLRGLIAAAPAGIGLFVGRDLIIENPNQTFIDIVGKGPDIAGLPLREAMPELLTEGQPFLKILDDIYNTGVPFISPASLVKIVQNGVLNNNYYNISYTPVYNSAGEIYAILDIAIDVTEQVKAQQGLAYSEAHLQLLRDTVPAMIFYLDEEQRYRSCNVIFTQWFDVNAEDALGKTVREFLGEVAYEKARPHLDIAYAGQQERYELAAPSRMGRERWLSIVYTPHKTADGKVLGLIVHATDITQSKRTEFELRNSEARFRSLIEEAPVATCLFTGRDMKVNIANEMMLDFWGKDSSIRNKPLVEAVPILAGQPFLDILDHVFITGEPYVAKNARADLEKDGVVSTYYFDFTYKPLRDAAGEVYGIMDMAVDVTQQVIALQELKEKEISLRNAIEIAELGTWIMDMATGSTHLSQRYADLFGFDSIEMPLANTMSVIHHDDTDKVVAAFRKAQLPGGDGKYEAEYRIINARTGRQQVIHALGQTYFNEQGEPVRVVGTAQDITIQRELQTALEAEVQERTEALGASNEELQATNEQLLRSNEELAQYAYVASHDLQEPLRKIRIFSGMIDNDNALPENTRNYIAKISKSAERMSMLIRDLLEFSRLLKSDILRKPVALGKVVDAVWTDFELIVNEKGAAIEIGELPEIEAVSLQMNQLFYNLISNSLKFMVDGRKPLITIGSSMVTYQEVSKFVSNPGQATTYYRITVTDNGIGFESKYHEQIFEVFNRLHAKEIYPGSGIGLALCRRIVRNHNGYLYAESEVGKGTTFHIILPDRQNGSSIISR